MGRRRKYKSSLDLPIAVRELKTFDLSEIQEWVLKEYNKEISPQSISNWKRHYPDVVKQLQEELIREDVGERTITMDMFDSGVFEMLPMVRKWDLGMRRAKGGKGIKNRVGNIAALKRICQGIKPKINPRTQKLYRKGEKEREGTNGVDLKQHGWVITHPHQLTITKMQQWVDIALEHYPEMELSKERLVARNFLMANGIHVTSWDISGKKAESAGSYSRMFCERAIIEEIFNYLKKNDFEAYVIDKFLFKTATRISAALATRLEDIRCINGVYDIQVFDKGDKYWPKYVSPDLIEDIRALTGYPEKKAGNLFTYTDQEMSDINKEMLEMFYPEIWEQFPFFNQHNHFWRHMFAQHMLRATNWNLGMVAALGGWDTKSLEESYGKAPMEQMRKWGTEMITNL